MTTTAYSPFTVEWKDKGGAQGIWEGSNPTVPVSTSPLSSWVVISDSTYQFNFTTFQGSGQPFTVFSVMCDPAAGKDYGAKIIPSASATEQAQLTFTPAGNLELTASKLISGDPKLKISPSTSQPTLYLEWKVDGSWAWSYTKTGAFEAVTGDIDVGPGDVDVFVTDETSTTNILAVYYLDSTNAPGTNVGIVQSQTLVDAADTKITVVPRFELRDPFTCTLNLMATLPAPATLASSAS